MAVNVFFKVLTGFALFHFISGHGYLYDPPNRASLWRYLDDQPQNFEDNQYFCGGFDVQYGQNNGLCGPCGDDYSDPQPRNNENTGFYGRGIILRNYTAGQIVKVNVILTANHLGTFTYSLCKLEDPSLPETEECFNDLLLSDGQSSYVVASNDYNVVNYVQLPEGVTCNQCVLRWHYKCGNSWGDCEDGTGAIGCGAQEIFRSCADITIY